MRAAGDYDRAPVPSHLARAQKDPLGGSQHRHLMIEVRLQRAQHRLQLVGRRDQRTTPEQQIQSVQTGRCDLIADHQRVLWSVPGNLARPPSRGSRSLTGTIAAGSVTWISVVTPWLRNDSFSRQFQFSILCQSALRLSLAKPIRTTADTLAITCSVFGPQQIVCNTTTS